jgi:Protein of unknown function (DUF2997)
MPKQIFIDIDPQGNVTVEADGYKGKGCEAATKAYEQCLGKTTQRTKKPEWQQQASANQQVGG